MSAPIAIAVAVAFVWLGLVGGISFIEAPVKFRAPGVTLAIGLGIGRLVFRVVNLVEAALAVIVVITVVLHRPAPVTLTGLLVAVVALLAQLALVRPGSPGGPTPYSPGRTRRARRRTLPTSRWRGRR